MNAERLHVIAKAIREDISKSNSEVILQQLISALQSQISSPGQPQFQQQVSQNLTTLIQNLKNAPSNDFSPAWIQIIEETGINSLLGRNLKTQIEEIFARNQITPQIVLEELKTIHEKLHNLVGGLDNLLNSFQILKIGTEHVNPGECEVGILVPRAFVDNRLDKFADELSELDKIFEVFAEVSTGERPGFLIKTISSSELSVFFDSTAPVVACIAVAIERIVTLYKQLLEIRKLQNELSNQGLEKDKLRGVEDHANTLMEKGIQTLVPELLRDFYKGNDGARKNELEIALKFSLKKIANRIDRGFNVEVRVEPVDNEKRQQNTEGEGQQNDYQSMIENAAKKIQFMKLEGSPILNLPESDDKPKKK